MDWDSPICKPRGSSEYRPKHGEMGEPTRFVSFRATSPALDCVFPKPETASVVPVLGNGMSSQQLSREGEAAVARTPGTEVHSAHSGPGTVGAGRCLSLHSLSQLLVPIKLLPNEESCYAFQISKSNSVWLSFHYIQVKMKWQGPLSPWEGWPPKWLAQQDGLQVTKPLLLTICFRGVRHRTSEGQDSKPTEDESDRDPGRSQGPNWRIWRRKTRLEAPPPPTSSPP